MKKAVVFHHVANMGGGTISFADVCKMLSEKYDVTVIIPKKNSEYLTKLLAPYAKIIYFNARMPQFSYYSGSSSIISRGFFNSYFVSHSEINEIVSLITQENPDVIIANSMVQLRMGKYLKNLKAKKIMYIRETFRENIISKYMIKYINKYFDGVLCIAPYEKQYANFEIPCEVVGDCVSNNVSFDGEKKFDVDDCFNVLYVGGTSQLKGFCTFMKSIKYVKSKKIRFIMAGNNDEMKVNLKNCILHMSKLVKQRYGLYLLKKQSFRIDNIGFINNVGEIMKQVDVLVFPASKPHQPRPAIEAGEFYTAVIISDFKQTKDYFVNKYNCLTFKKNNPKELAEKIELFYSDKDLYEKTIKNNKEMNLKYHNFEKEEKKLINFIERL